MSWYSMVGSLIDSSETVSELRLTLNSGFSNLCDKVSEIRLTLTTDGGLSESQDKSKLICLYTEQEGTSRNQAAGTIGCLKWGCSFVGSELSRMQDGGLLRSAEEQTAGGSPRKHSAAASY